MLSDPFGSICTAPCILASQMECSNSSLTSLFCISGSGLNFGTKRMTGVGERESCGGDAGDGVEDDEEEEKKEEEEEEEEDVKLRSTGSTCDSPKNPV
jgi:hypothetical protein